MVCSGSSNILKMDFLIFFVTTNKFNMSFEELNNKFVKVSNDLEKLRSTTVKNVIAEMVKFSRSHMESLLENYKCHFRVENLPKTVGPELYKAVYGDIMKELYTIERETNYKFRKCNKCELCITIQWVKTKETYDPFDLGDESLFGCNRGDPPVYRL